MSQYQYNTGRDNTVMLLDSTGATVQLNGVKNWSFKRESSTIEHKNYDGTIERGEMVTGYTGSFELDRADATLDIFFATLDAAWLQNGLLPYNQLFQYIDELDGSQTVWQYIDITLKYDEGGDWKPDSNVEQKVSFTAKLRKQVQ